jgi:TonB family protein
MAMQGAKDQARPHWVVRRRARGRRPARRRVGSALARGPAAAPVGEFPGLPGHATSRRSHVLSGALSVLLHAGLVGGLVLFAWLAPPELVEEILPLELVNEPLPESSPAPAPRAIAESRGAFAPAPQAFKAQIENPSVAARAVPTLPAEALELDAVSSVAAPTDVKRQVIAAEQVSAVRSIAAATVSPVAVAPVAPALRGPIDLQAPAGPSVGPRAVATGGDTAGFAAPGALGTGSSVREGIASDRDVAGSATGPRLASVNTRVGEGLRGAGPGGEGTGQGVSFEECTKRPEVQAYLEQVHQRMYARWILPAQTPPNQSIRLRFRLDPSGSATNVRFLEAPNQLLGESAVQALRAASPFPPMPERARCLAQDSLTAIFRNPVGAS